MEENTARETPLQSFYSSYGFEYVSAAINDLQEPTTHYNLITLLAIAQKGGVDLLPLQRDPLRSIGRGGTANIGETTLRVNMSFAFKHTTLSLPGQKGTVSERLAFQALCMEVLILDQAPIREHPNIVKLDGICWEVDASRYGDPEIWPVLVMEKAPCGNLQDFMTHEGASISIVDRLRLCGEILMAIETMHQCCMQLCIFRYCIAYLMNLKRLFMAT